MKILLGGALGRMGREVQLAARQSGSSIVYGVDLLGSGNTDFPCCTSFAALPQPIEADVLIDFSKPSALEELLAFAVAQKLPCVLCATGYTEAQLTAIARAAETVPVLRSANMSLGVNALLELCAIAARVLPDFDIEIVEKHHRMKQDAPSGTALMLYESVAAERVNTQKIEGRSGHSAKREVAEIGISAVRGGTVVGEHEVGFYGEGEQVLLTHRAENRALFANGALTAAQYLIHQPSGLYSMREVIKNKLKETLQ